MRKVCSVIALLVLAASFPALAAQGDMILRFGGAYVSPTGDYSEAYDIEGDVGVYKEEAGSAVGEFVGFEYMVSDLIGIDATLLYSKLDAKWSERGTYLDEPYSDRGTYGDITFMPLFIGANFHFMQEGNLDFYAGPFLAYVMYGDVNATEGPMFDICTKNDLGYGAVVGLDVPLGSGGWRLTTALRYLQTGAESDEDPEFYDNYTVDVNPIIVQVGAGIKF